MRSGGRTASSRRARAALLTALALASAGCPREEPGAAPPRAPATLEAEPDAPREETAMPEPSEPSAPESLSREELLARAPEAVLAGGLRGEGPEGLAPELAGAGALALVEQLRAAGVPREALELCLVQLDRAREQAPPGELSDAALERLRSDLAVQTRGHPALERWMTALAGHLLERSDLEAAVTFVSRAWRIWQEGDALRQRGAQPPR